MEDDTTIGATITLEDIARAETSHSTHNEAVNELDRFLGTIECYGAYPINRPNLSSLTESYTDDWDILPDLKRQTG